MLISVVHGYIISAPHLQRNLAIVNSNKNIFKKMKNQYIFLPLVFREFIFDALPFADHFFNFFNSLKMRIINVLYQCFAGRQLIAIWYVMEK